MTGQPHAILRLEGAVLLIAATAAYAHFDGGWLLFALLFLAPDVAMLGYLVDRRIGATIYNLGHSTALPAALAAIGWWTSEPLATRLALIWLAHIGFDRPAGYGLKYPTAFGHSHLGRFGKAAQTAPADGR